jgi:proline racemase
METSHSFSTIDTHTAGEPTRIVTDGLLFSPGEKTTLEYREEFRESFDWVRQLLMKEPRGHDDMFGAVPVSTATPEADLGVFFITNDGYLEMCGHATIGTITAFVELGRLPAQDTIVVETPAGLVETRLTVTERTVESVEFRNVESFLYDSLSVTLDSGQAVDVDVVFAGNFFAMVDVADVGRSLTREDTRQLIELGTEIRRKTNASLDVVHPFTGAPSEVALTEFYERSEGGDRNLTVFGNGSVDRSPCGTGTCAKMTLLHNRGELDLGETYHHLSVIDTEFEGEIESTARRDGYDVVTPLVRGSAYIIARNEYSLHPDDPLIGFNITGESP